MGRPNILYINSHDTGRYIRPYGHDIPTPNLQRFAEEGVLFRHAFCAGPTCSPSRAALLTGQCPHSAGMLGLAHGAFGWRLKDYSQHLLHTLRREAGYFSVLCGFQHLVGNGQVESIGYDRFFERDAETHAVEFLENAPQQPFFLEVGFFETHRLDHIEGGPFNAPARTGDGRFVQPPIPVPDTPQTRADMADFAVAAQRLDAKIGSVLEALERSGLKDKTLVIVTTDHGLSFPGMKCQLNDQGLGVLLLMRGPGPFAGGQIINGMVSHLDIFPTLCDYLEIEKPDWLQGRSMLPLLNGEVTEINEQIFAEVTYHAAYEPKRAVRTPRWKYIRYFDGLRDDERFPVLPNCDPSPSREVWLEYGGDKIPVAAQQLYDLMLDPNEMNNLAANAAYQPVLNEMRERLDWWMQDTQDPLLNGPVPPCNI